MILETLTLKLSSWAFKKWKKRCARSTFRFAGTLELPRLYILSDKEGFAIQLWFKSVKENTNHALCFTALDNSVLYSPFLYNGLFLWLLKIKHNREIDSVKCYILGKKQSKWNWSMLCLRRVCLVLRKANHTAFLIKIWNFQNIQFTWELLLLLKLLFYCHHHCQFFTTQSFWRFTEFKKKIIGVNLCLLSQSV